MKKELDLIKEDLIHKYLTQQTLYNFHNLVYKNSYDLSAYEGAIYTLEDILKKFFPEVNLVPLKKEGVLVATRRYEKYEKFKI